MIELKNICKNYGEKIVLNDLCLSVPEKGLCWIKGVSGSGKSTLLKIMGLIDKPSKGEIYFKGKAILSTHDMNLILNKYISILYQENYLFSNCTVLENLEIVSNDKNKINEILKKLKIDRLINKKCVNLSGGEKQRVSIAMSVLKGTKVILLDEPTSSLDYKTAKIILDYLKELSKEILIIMVSHNDYLLNKYADFIFLLEEGKIKKINEKRVDQSNIQLEKKTKRNISAYFLIVKKQIDIVRSRMIFVKTLFSICVSVLLTCFSTTMSSNDDYVYNNFKKNNIQTLVIDYNNASCNNINSLAPNNEYIEILDTKNFINKLDYEAVYSNSDYYNQYIFSSTIINNNLSDYEIIITDYDYENLKYYINSDDFSKNIIKLKNNKLVIKEIQKVNSSLLYSLGDGVLNNKYSKDYKYIKENYLSLIQMNEKTLKEIGFNKNTLKKKYIIFFEDYESTYKFYIINKSDDNHFITYIGFHVLEDTFGLINKFTKLFYALLILFTILFLFSFISYEITILKRNKKNSGLLLSVGYNFLELSVIYSIYILKILLFSFLGGLLIYFLLTTFLNKSYSIVSYLPFIILDIPSIIYVFLSLVILFFVNLIVLLLFFSSKNIQKIIN